MMSDPIGALDDAKTELAFVAVNAAATPRPARPTAEEILAAWAKGPSRADMMQHWYMTGHKVRGQPGKEDR